MCPRQSQWSRRLRRRFSAARLLRLWVRIPSCVWMSICCECYVLSGRGLCEELIIRPEETYRLWCIVVCDLETSWRRKPWPTGGQGFLFQKQTKRRARSAYELRHVRPQSVPLSTRPRVAGRLPLNRLLRNLILETFMTNCHVNPNLVKLGQGVGNFTWIPN
jgi:hypothetical protein